MEITSVSSKQYKKSRCCMSWAKVSLYIASLIIVLSLIFPEGIIVRKEWYYINLLQILLVVSFQVLSLISSVYNFLGRKIKINDLVDNSFGSKQCNLHSSNYYDNEEYVTGEAKFYLNTAESCFFSYKEMLYMQPCVYVKNLFIVIIFIAGLAMKSTDIILSIFQITVLVSILISTARFVVSLIALHNLFSRIDTSLKHESSIEQFRADGINYSLEYETTMVWFNSLLSEKIYKRYNTELTEEWNKIKRNYKIF